MEGKVRTTVIRTVRVEMVMSEKEAHELAAACEYLNKMLPSPMRGLSGLKESIQYAMRAAHATHEEFKDDPFE